MQAEPTMAAVVNSEPPMVEPVNDAPVTKALSIVPNLKRCRRKCCGRGYHMLMMLLQQQQQEQEAIKDSLAPLKAVDIKCLIAGSTATMDISLRY